MKKTLLFAFVLMFSMAAMAQTRTTILEESFDAGTMPSGWQVMEMGTSCWSISATQNAGGSPNELKLYYSPQFNGTSRFVSPAVDLTGVSSVIFSFKHCLDNYSGSHTLGVATTSDNGTTWNVGWSQVYSSDGVWNINQEITTPDMGQSNVRFCIYYTGNSYNIDNWYFDDILVFTLENLDLGLTGTSMPAFAGSGNMTMDMTVFNYGATTVTSVEASYTVEGMTTVTETFSVNMAPLASATLTFAEPATFRPGTYSVDFSIDKVNGEDDDIADNNTLLRSLSVALTTAERIPMIEHFSSSTCGPCVSVNTQMLNFCNNNPGRFTYTKYQMNWPGNGDPYYTEEGGVRRNYYGVSAVPQCFLDGEDQGYAAVQQSVFDQHAQRAAFMDIRGSFSVDGNVINVLVDVMPYIDAEARLFVSVNEKETHNNVGGNGETSFHHIFMKMLPNAQGSTRSFVANELTHLEFTQDMSSTHVEEMSDLEVSIWVQEYSTHEMFNSHFAYEYTEAHPYPVENLTLGLGRGNMLASWNAPANGTPVGYDVYVNGELAASGITDTQYAFDADPEDFNFVEVVAVYADDMTSVKCAAAFDGVIAVCDPVTDLVAEYGEFDDEQGAVVSWTEPEGAISYKVYVNEVLIGEVVYQPVELSFNGDPVGTYTIGIVAVYDGCESDMATVEFEWTDPLSVAEEALSASIYPNPTNGNFIVEGSEMASVEVYNLVGQKVFEAQGNAISVDASNWEKGLYLVNIKKHNGSMETRKLMVK